MICHVNYLLLDGDYDYLPHHLLNRWLFCRHKFPCMWYTRSSKSNTNFIKILQHVMWWSSWSWFWPHFMLDQLQAFLHPYPFDIKIKFTLMIYIHTKSRWPNGIPCMKSDSWNKHVFWKLWLRVSIYNSIYVHMCVYCQCPFNMGSYLPAHLRIGIPSSKECQYFPNLFQLVFIIRWFR